MKNCCWAVEGLLVKERKKVGGDGGVGGCGWLFVMYEYMCAHMYVFSLSQKNSHLTKLKSVKVKLKFFKVMLLEIRSMGDAGWICKKNQP